MSTTPTVAFIDDSATMREVIKIAFRRENIDVVTYSDAASALQQIEQKAPDVVITDVIMPDKDGYEVCQHIKQHPRLGKVPVILMSGVVNRAVADKAFTVKADELIRKPFQPQDLITRVKHLLQPAADAASPAPTNAAAALSSIFGAPAQAAVRRPVASVPAVAAPVAVAAGAPAISAVARPQAAPTPAPAVSLGAQSAATAQRSSISAGNDPQKLRVEISRLEGLVKKLQSELAAEREYTRSLEEHMKTLQEA